MGLWTNVLIVIRKMVADGQDRKHLPCHR